MGERIILAPGANGQELLKNLAMHGVMSFNLRIMAAGELARLALMRSGIPVTEDFASASEETAIIAEAVKTGKYFGNATYSDVKQISLAIRRMRSLAAADESFALEQALGRGTFTEKNAALLSVYRRYQELLAEKNRIDTIGLIRKAIALCGKIDAEFITLDEYPLKPIEQELLHKLAETSVRMSLKELYKAKEVPLCIDSISDCYGAPNEVEAIIADIYKNRTLDSCTVAVTDPQTYGQLFFDYALRYDLPVTFGCGIPIHNSYPAKLLTIYYHWMTDGFFGAVALAEMLDSSAFDRRKLAELYPEKGEAFIWRRYKEIACALRFTNDKAVNDARLADYKKTVTGDETQYVPFLEVLAGELALPAEEFIYKYAYIRRGSKSNSETLLTMLDSAAASAIYDELKIIRASGAGTATEDMIRNVLRKSVAAAGSEAGKVYVTGIAGALPAVRENLYVAGLSANKYPGSPKENYLLLDEDLEHFGKGAERMTSQGMIEQKRADLFALVRLASSLNAKIFLSYAGMNVSELKHDNPSSLVYELFREAKGDNATSKELEDATKKIDYFAPEISDSRKIGEAYNNGVDIRQRPAGAPAGSIGSDSYALKKEYSPSALSTFFNCPRQFMLSYIIGLPQPDDYDPFEVIPSTDAGKLAHSLMEELANSGMSEEEFLKRAGEVFDRYLMQNPPLVPEKAAGEREQFLDMMQNAYKMDPKCEVPLKEEDIHSKHESGVKLHGFPDRIEKTADGTYRVVDFKTGRSLGHVQDDIDTCLQTVIYAYLMEKNGFKISGTEYRYLRLNETVTCKYDDEMKDKLTVKLNEFKEKLETADYPVSEFAISRTKDDPDPCKYCKYGMICGKPQKGGPEDE
jgi:RecB family exonuclease